MSDINKAVWTGLAQALADADAVLEAAMQPMARVPTAPHNSPTTRYVNDASHGIGRSGPRPTIKY